MASKRIQKWMEDEEEVKTNLAVLIDSPLLVNSESQPELGDTTDGCTDGTRKRARKLTVVMQESQEQQKSDNENIADNQKKHRKKKGRRTTKRPTTSILKATKRTKESRPRKGQ